MSVGEEEFFGEWLWAAGGGFKLVRWTLRDSLAFWVECCSYSEGKLPCRFGEEELEVRIMLLLFLSLLKNSRIMSTTAGCFISVVL